jgi:hypothetical protein
MRHSEKSKGRHSPCETGAHLRSDVTTGSQLAQRHGDSVAYRGVCGWPLPAYTSRDKLGR